MRAKIKEMKVHHDFARPEFTHNEGVQHREARRSSVGWHQYRCAFVLYKDHDEFRWLGFACVSTDDVDIIRAFVEGLTRC